MDSVSWGRVITRPEPKELAFSIAREPEERMVLPQTREPDTVWNSSKEPVTVVFRENAVPVSARFCPAVYVVSLSVPQLNLLVVASQARVCVAASQSVRPAPSREVATYNVAPEAAPSPTREPDERRGLPQTREPDTVWNSSKEPVTVVFRENAVPVSARFCPAVYVVSLSVPQLNLLVVASQARVCVAASQSVRPAPSREVATYNVA